MSRGRRLSRSRGSSSNRFERLSENSCDTSTSSSCESSDVSDRGLTRQLSRANRSRPMDRSVSRNRGSSCHDTNCHEEVANLNSLTHSGVFIASDQDLVNQARELVSTEADQAPDTNNRHQSGLYHATLVIMSLRVSGFALLIRVIRFVLHIRPYFVIYKMRTKEIQFVKKP